MFVFSATLYGHRFHGQGSHYLPAHDRHMYLTPVNEHKQRVSHQMPKQNMGHHMPVHHAGHGVLPAHVPARDHVVPHHAPVHMPLHKSAAHVPALTRPYDHVPIHGSQRGNLYGADHMVHDHVVGAGHKGKGGMVRFGANLVGGVITGHDTRFSNL